MTFAPHCAGSTGQTQVIPRLHLGTGIALHHCGLCSACRARWCGCQAGLQVASPHATPRLWIRVGQQRARYPGAAGLSGAQEHPAHGTIHRAVTGSVQGLLAGLTARACNRTTKVLRPSRYPRTIAWCVDIGPRPSAGRVARSLNGCPSATTSPCAMSA
jgi:hypothetical protein